MSKTCIVIGASHAAAQLVASLRQEGWEDRIIVIGDEAYLPYHRPPLSKGFLAGDKQLDEIYIRPAKFYEQRDIEFKLNTRVTKIDRENKSVTLDSGESINYDKLALTVGARVRKIDLPGKELAGIHYLRDAADAEAIQQDLPTAKTAVIVGGGYIGLELAASLRKANIEVTLLEALPRILARVTAEEISNFYTRVHSEEGVRICTGVGVAGFGGENGRVSYVETSDGTRYPADIVTVGVGVIPNTELADEIGLTIDNGILVDEFARTNDPDIVAAGDCTNHPNPLLGRNIRLESVPNASDQAKSAAASICGLDKVYSALPWFWSDQYDLKLQIAGLNQGYDDVVVRGDIAGSRSFAAYYLKEGRVIAVDCVNRPQEFMTAKQALSKGLEFNTASLADESIAPKELVINE